MRRKKRKSHAAQYTDQNQSAGNALFITLICLIMILSIFMSFSVSHVSAQENTRTVTEQLNKDVLSNHKYYRSIEIQRGDTLWEIAKDSMTSEYNSISEYIKALKEINGLDSDEIQAGRMLIIEVEYDK